MATTKRSDKYISPHGGRYRVEMTHPTTKERVRESFDTIEAARAWRDKTRGDWAMGKVGLAQRLTAHEVFADFTTAARKGVARNRKREVYAASTLRQLESNWELFWATKLGGMLIGDIDRTHVQRCVDELVARDLKHNTIQVYKSTVCVMFRWAVRQGYVPNDDAVKLLELPARDAETRGYVEAGDVPDLLACLGDPVLRAMWATAFYAGLRFGELAALRWVDVNLAAGVLHVTRGFDPEATRENVADKHTVLGWPDTGRGGYVPTKNRGTRDVPIAQALVPYLAALDTTEGLVFGDAPNRPRREPTRQARRIWEDLGRTSVKLHEARHSFASMLIAAGANLKQVQELMGHNSITITMDTYGHLYPSSRQDAIDALDAMLTPTTV